MIKKETKSCVFRCIKRHGAISYFNFIKKIIFNFDLRCTVKQMDNTVHTRNCNILRRKRAELLPGWLSQCRNFLRVKRTADRERKERKERRIPSHSLALDLFSLSSFCDGILLAEEKWAELKETSLGVKRFVEL